MSPTLTLRAALTLLLVLAVAGCGGDGAPRVCAPGEAQTCPCLGGFEAVQTCAADGTRWETCQCASLDGGVAQDAAGADAATGADAPTGADAGCANACATLGETSCDGTSLKVCAADGAGCLALDTVKDCATDSQICDDGATPAACAVPAFCSATGEACSKSVGCTDAAVTGFCIPRKDVSGYSMCGYAARHPGNGTVTCTGDVVARCQTTWDCPAGASCGSAATNWCETSVTGLCARASGAQLCTVDADCTYTPTNQCLACGDGVVDAPQEECDDGNQAAGDGCSPECQFEGSCRTASQGSTSTECATVADCAESLFCQLDGPCTCQIP